PPQGARGVRNVPEPSLGPRGNLPVPPFPLHRPAFADRLLRSRLELVADAVARLDERVPRRAAVDLLAHLADEDVDGAVAPRLPAAPHALEQLVPRDDAAALQRQRVEQPELCRRQADALAVDVRLDLVRVDAEL